MAAPLPAHMLQLGLARSPFPSTPDAILYFEGNGLRERLAELLHCVLARKGFVLISGEVGLGKSTLLRRLVSQLSAQSCRVALVMNTHLRGDALLRAILRDLGLNAGSSFDDDLAVFNAFLIERHHQGETVAIVIDDAQNLCPESLELIRLLSNLETSQDKLVQIVLCGQPELLDALGNPAVRQLASRISKHVEITPLSLAETASYVRFRLDSASAEQIRIAPAAIRVLHRCSAGNPRRMHLILDTCLYGLVASRARQIDAAMVRQAAAEAGIRRAARAQPPVIKNLAIAAGLLLGVIGLALAGALLLPQEQVNASISEARPAAAVAPDRAPREIAPASQVDDFVDCLAPLAGASPDELALWAADPDLLATRLMQAAPDLVLTRFSAERISVQPAESCLLRQASADLLVWRSAHVAQDFALGSSGGGVRALQQALADVGLYQAALDGQMGPRTVAAVAHFQRLQGLPASGYPDNLTRLLLEQPTMSSDIAREDS